MSINLMALLTLLLMQVMITVILNSLWRMLKKTGFLLKALLLQVPLFRGTFLQMKELEEETARRKADRKRIPEQRQPTLEMEADPGNRDPERNPRQGQNPKQKQKRSRNPEQNQNPERNRNPNRKQNQDPEQNQGQ